MKELLTQVTKCRVCGSETLFKYLDLGLMPIANNLGETSQEAKLKIRFPLEVMFCNQCGLSQLSVVVNPEKMFCYYTYRSSINKGYIKHCEDMAKDLIPRFNLNSDTFHIDIGGNDGTLLLEFQKLLSHRILNVDPSDNMTKVAVQKGVPSMAGFWGNSALYEIGERADIMTATNVFAHLDNVAEFIVSCRGMMKPHTILVIENPYIIDFTDNMEFDTIYFEHMSYWSVLPMLALCDKYHLKLVAAEHQKIHGGSMRYIIAREDSNYVPSPEIKKIMQQEEDRKFNTLSTYISWADKVHKSILDFKSNLINLVRKNKTIIAFAASAKGNTLLNSAGIDSTIVECIIDETPEKIGKFYPGNGIPIVGIEWIMKIHPDYILILSWNFKDEIIYKVKNLGYKGKFIVPIPSWEII